MPVSIIVGGQYGSEGKGKATLFWTNKMNASAVVRVGGTNSGHTIYKDSKRYAFRMLPSGCMRDDCISILAAGSYIDLEVLKDEISKTNMTPDKLFIDENAVIISNNDRYIETRYKLGDRISSTLSGTGGALIHRILRSGDAILAKEVSELKDYISDTKRIMRTLLDDGKHIVIEGTQGYGLSNYHAKTYPYVTARDTSASGFLSEAGLSPLDVDHVVMVIRSYPIRVGGSSGPLKNEIDWKTVAERTGTSENLTEYTTVTHKPRRVGEFDSELVKEAIIANNPDYIIMNHVDYIDYDNKNSEMLSDKQVSFVNDIVKRIGRRIDYVGNGENVFIEVHYTM